MRIKTLFAAVTLAVTGSMLAASTCVAYAPVDDGPRVLIIGDSMTSEYNNVGGSPDRGWWSMVAAAKGWTPVTSAVYGTGFMRRGPSCKSGNFTTRIGEIERLKPKVLIVAGGRNDTKKCVNGKLYPASDSEAISYAARYFSDLKREADAVGISKYRRYVITPWGSADVARSKTLRPKIRDTARKYGFTWITTWVLSRSQTYDGYHQNAAGNKKIASDVLKGM